jgi:hypothetical protein
MPAPKGNRNAAGNRGGRPRRLDPSDLSASLAAYASVCAFLGRKATAVEEALYLSFTLGRPVSRRTAARVASTLPPASTGRLGKTQ